jgi:hypothetical protein
VPNCRKTGPGGALVWPGLSSDGFAGWTGYELQVKDLGEPGLARSLAEQRYGRWLS